MRYQLPGVGPAPKAYRDGTHRLTRPEETLARVAPAMKGMGITRVANITGLDTVGIPVAIACRPNARSLSVSQGKGLSLAAAKASALMESVEFWHAEHMALPLRLGSFAELSAEQAVVDVSRLPRLSVSTFDADSRVLWVEGFDLIGQETKWVPYECVHADYRVPLPAGSGCFPINSNGLASGNHLLEATVHGLCEVIERDATTLWHAGGENARQAMRVRTSTVEDRTCLRLLEQFAAAGVLAALWRTTSDLGVPCYVCEIVDDEEHQHRGLGPSAGMGAHLSEGVAACRALTEAAQGRLTRIASSRDDIPRLDYEITRNQDVLAAVREEYAAEGELPFSTGASSSAHEDFAGDLESLVEALVNVGVEEAVVVDLTCPEFAIPVVRVLVPGLEPPHEATGYVPGPRAQAAGTVL